MKIGVDIDEVVASFMKEYLRYHNLKHNSSYVLEDITSYNLWECGVHSSKKESVDEVNEFQNTIYFDSIGLIEGAKEGLSNILKKYFPFFITSRPSRLKNKTKLFFHKNFQMNGCDFIFSAEIYGGKTKAEICRELGLRTMIEDHPLYALDCAKNGIKTLLLDKPWNKNYEKHENILKVNNWKEIGEILI